MSSTMAEPAPAAHTPSRNPYFLTCAFLLVMTLITYVVAKFDLGPLNDVVALSIAVFKATAVILFFMHVRHSSNLTKLTVVSGFLLLPFKTFITLSEHSTRVRL